MTPTHSSDTNAYFNPNTEAHMRRIASGLRTATKESSAKKPSKR